VYDLYKKSKGKKGEIPLLEKGGSAITKKKRNKSDKQRGGEERECLGSVLSAKGQVL